MIEVDSDDLWPAAEELGTTGVEDTVNAALRHVADRGSRIERLFSN